MLAQPPLQSLMNYGPHRVTESTEAVFLHSVSQLALSVVQSAFLLSFAYLWERFLDFNKYWFLTFFELKYPKLGESNRKKEMISGRLSE